MVILNTDTLTIVQYGHGTDFERLRPRLETTPTEDVFVSILSFEEQARGWLAQLSKAKTMVGEVVAYHRLYTLLQDYANRKILPFTSAAASTFQRLRKAKLKLGSMDLRIAA